MSVKDLIESDDFLGIQEAVNNGSDINAVDRSGSTPLMRAVVKRRIDIIEWLLIKGSDVNQQDKKGWSALHFAAQEGDILVLSKLIEAIPMIDPKDENGNTPLLRAISANKSTLKEICTRLVKAGANPDNKNNHDVSPRDIEPDLF